jgi:hypothetical protein
MNCISYIIIENHNNIYYIRETPNKDHYINIINKNNNNNEIYYEELYKWYKYKNIKI